VKFYVRKPRQRKTVLHRKSMQCRNHHINRKAMHVKSSSKKQKQSRDAKKRIIRKSNARKKARKRVHARKVAYL
jgi:hypothetical protein